MKENYLAWQITSAKYSEAETLEQKLRFLIRFAVLAPSSHNSQPWKFKQYDSRLEIRPENSRRLAISDSNDRQLYISLGCAVENILIAANYFGMTASVHYTLHGADIMFTQDGTPKTDEHLMRSISTRSTNRNPYTGPVSNEFLSSIQALSNSELTVFPVAEQASKNKIADAVLGGLGDAMDDPKFRNELSHYVINNLSSQKTGMPAFGLGIPTPPSFFVPTVLKYINIHRLSRKQEEKLLKEQTPVFVIIATQKDVPDSWMDAGRTYQHIALMAENAGLKTNVMAAAIQIGDYYKVLQEVLGTQLRPQVFFRLGLCSKNTAHSPRLSADEVLAK